MRSRKAFKRSLSAVLCAAMLINPMAAANATENPGGEPRSPEITEEYLEGKIPAYFYIWDLYTDIEPDGSLFKGHCTYFYFKANISISICNADTSEEIDNIDLGEFYSGTEASLLAGLPTVIRDEYGDRSKYKVYIIVKPVDLPSDRVMVDESTMMKIDEYRFEYNNENELKDDINISISDKVSVTQSGVIHLKAPEKKVYKIGEELDVTGGKISGFGDFADKSMNLTNKWTLPERDLTLDDLDISEFDNTKAGEYLIKAKPVNMNTEECNEYHDTTVYDSFYVTVSDDENAASKKETTKFNIKINYKGSYNKEYIKFNVAYYYINEEELTEEVINFDNLKMDENDVVTIEVPSEFADTEKSKNLGFYITISDLEQKSEFAPTIEKRKFTYEDMVDNTVEVKVTSPYDYYNFYIGNTPTKLIYKVGEELDLTGGLRRGSGQLPDGGGYWDDFGTPLSLDMLDVSDFDNTKPGVYTIKGKGNVSGEFKVYVYSEDEMPKQKFEFEVRKLDRDKSEEEYLPVNGMKFKIKASIYDNVNDKYEYFDCGEFDTEDGNTFTFEIPDELLERYYAQTWIDFYAIPVELPEKTEIEDADPQFGGFRFIYWGEPTEKRTILVRDQIVKTAEGKVTITPPKKLTYNIGEELSLEGAAITVDGTITDNSNNISYSLSEDTRQLCLDEIDASAFDNTKPGEYTIKIVFPTVSHGADVLINKLDLPEFKVTVVDNDKPGASKVSEKKGDANLDNEISLADAVAIMQFIANPDKHGLNEQAMKNSDVTGDNDGVTSKDALVIQKYKLNMIDSIE